MERASNQRSIPPLRRLILLYLGTTIGVLVLRWRRHGWYPVQHGLTGESITALAVVPDQAEAIYAASESLVYQSTDSGLHWRPLSGPPPTRPISALIAGPKARPSLLAGLETGSLVRSTNGQRWQAGAIPLSPTGGAVRLLATSGDPTQLLALAGDDLLLSTDGGGQWQPLAVGAPVTSLARHPDAPATLYSGGPEGLLRSRNGGRQWQRLSTEPVTAIMVHPTRPRSIIVASPHGLQVSQNAGVSWQPMVTSGADPADPVVRLFGWPHLDLLLAITHHGRLLHLIDGHWQRPITGPLPPITCATLAVGDVALPPGTPKRTQPRRKRPARKDATGAPPPPLPAQPTGERRPRSEEPAAERRPRPDGPGERRRRPRPPEPPPPAPSA